MWAIANGDAARDSFFAVFASSNQSQVPRHGAYADVSLTILSCFSVVRIRCHLGEKGWMGAASLEILTVREHPVGQGTCIEHVCEV